MTIHVISADTSTTINATLPSGDTWVVNAGVNVTTTGDAINGTGQFGGKNFLIYGNLIAEGDGIHLGNSINHNGGSNSVVISATASIFGDHAVESSGGHLKLTNEGILTGHSRAISAEDGSNVITNNGTITALNSNGIEVFGDFNRVSNSGTIVADDNAINVDFGNSAQITNTGSIASSLIGIYANGATMSVNNGGDITAIFSGIQISGNASKIENTGTISVSEGYGILLHNNDNILDNYGEIKGNLNGVMNDGDLLKLLNNGIISSSEGDGIHSSGFGSQILNYGKIMSMANSGYAGVNLFDNDASADVSLKNYGNISSTSGVAVLGDLDDTDKLWNFGTFDGNVLQAGGNDFFRNGGLVAGDVDLGSGADLFKGWGGTVDGSISGGNGNDTIAGGISDDVIFGNGGADVLKGGQGDDTLTGGGGFDILRGGLGFDTFDFNATSESAPGAQRDHIEDFAKDEDVIDLHTIDARAGVAGNQDFTFIGANAFSNTKGELRAVNSGADTKVLGDVNGDGTADFSILVENVHNLHAADFVL